jgi:predicted dienelactone hydrolase
MRNHFKQFVAAAAVIFAVSAPSAALARINLNQPPSFTPSAQIQAPVVPSVAHATASSPDGFRWADAMLGAAGMIVLIGVGCGVVVALRRRAHHPLMG